MTTITKDRSLRKLAIPFEASPYNSGSLGSIDPGGIAGSTATATQIALRCSTPANGMLVSADLNLEIEVVSALTVKVAIGRFDTDGISAVTSYPQAEIDRQHAIITGSSAAIAASGGVLFIDGLNIYPLLPKDGDATFNRDGFVLLLQFSRTRPTDTLKKFEVQCSAQMGLL